MTVGRAIARNEQQYENYESGTQYGFHFFYPPAA
jgi:hypothetical protein